MKEKKERKMKKLILLSFALIFAINIQQSKSQWSIAPQGGIILPVGSFGDGYKLSPFIGVDIGYKFNPNLTFCADVNYTFLSSKEVTTTQTTGGNITDASDSAGSNSPSAKMLEFTIGSKYYFGSGSTKFFGQGNMGMYIISVGSTEVNGVKTEGASNSNFGIKLGGGAEIPVSKSMDLVPKASFNIIFSSGSSSTYLSLGAGLKFKL